MSKMMDCKECAKRQLNNKLSEINAIKDFLKIMDELINKSDMLLHELSEMIEKKVVSNYEINEKLYKVIIQDCDNLTSNYLVNDMFKTNCEMHGITIVREYMDLNCCKIYEIIVEDTDKLERIKRFEYISSIEKLFTTNSDEMKEHFVS